MLSLCVSYKCNRVVCDYCNMSRSRDREPGGIPAKKRKRLSQKSRKLSVCQLNCRRNMSQTIKMGEQLLV